MSSSDRAAAASAPDGIVTSLIDDERLARAAAMGTPAFVRRAQAVESALQRLRGSIARERKRRVRFLLAAARQLQENRRRGDQLPAPTLGALDDLLQEPNFSERTAPPARHLKLALRAFDRQVQGFNERWGRYLEEVSLEDVHTAQTKYNRYYALEREMALRGLPPKPFVPLELMQRAELFERWPPLG